MVAVTFLKAVFDKKKPIERVCSVQSMSLNPYHNSFLPSWHVIQAVSFLGEDIICKFFIFCQFAMG
jgi:hypothetical protein